MCVSLYSLSCLVLVATRRDRARWLVFLPQALSQDRGFAPVFLKPAPRAGGCHAVLNYTYIAIQCYQYRTTIHDHNHATYTTASFAST